MLSFFLWYFILVLFALAALPLGWTWFQHLPDRGWGLLRPLGMLLVGFAVWFFGSFGLLRLSLGSGLAGLLALFGLGMIALLRWGGGWQALTAWLREHRTILLAQEVVFFLAFAFWTWYRIHDGLGISHTEQPMDFAFMNAIQRGGEMPPNDPWLSGFAISYYYLGYLIMAQIAALSGVASGVAYNLAFTTLAGLASLGIFSVAYNLLAGEERISHPATRHLPRAADLASEGSHSGGWHAASGAPLASESDDSTPFDSGHAHLASESDDSGAVGARHVASAVPLASESDDLGGLHAARPAHLRHLAIALLAVVLLLGISNLTGLLTMTYHLGIGPDSLYAWFGVHDLVPDSATGNRAPLEGWWWWKASRTLYDAGPDGGRIEVIDEFPFFSFLLGDMHPHVLALPFTLLGITIGLNALRAALTYPVLRRWRIAMQPPESWAVGSSFSKLTFLLTAIVIGAMGMLNTWDYPTQGAILAAVWLIAALLGGRNEPWRSSLVSWLSGGALLLVSALMLYLPFYIGFRSQADGIRVSQWSTRPQQYLLMFGLFWLVLLPLTLSQGRRIIEAIRTIGQRTQIVSAIMLLVDSAVLFLLLQFNIEQAQLAILMAGFWLLIPLALSAIIGDQDPTPLAIIQVAGFPLLAGLATQRFTIALVAFLLLLTLLAIWARVRALLPLTESSEAFWRISARPIIASGSQNATPDAVDLHSSAITHHSSLIFALLLSALALLLTMGSDIFYIKDGFPGRMNTIFKLYYQAWVLMAIASTFGVAYLTKRMPLGLRVPWLALFALLILGSMWYPFEALSAKANFDSAPNWDGRFWMKNIDPDRFAAIEWLDALPDQVVILEKKGDSYRGSESALAGWTGHSTLIGWAGHELQWRGSYEEVGRREPIIQQIYQNTDAQATRTLIEEWNIDYVVITPAERTTYNLTDSQINKFREFMTPVFEQGNVIIFGR